MVGTWELSKMFGLQHRALCRLLERYIEEFEELGKLQQIEIENSKKRGRRFNEYRLNENHSRLLCCLLPNFPNFIKIKKIVCKNLQMKMKDILKILPDKEHVEGYVYLINCTRGFTKIGKSRSPDERIKCIKTQGNIDVKNLYISKKTVEYGKIETEMHRKYCEFLISGEWFDVDFKEIKSCLIERVK